MSSWPWPEGVVPSLPDLLQLIIVHEDGLWKVRTDIEFSGSITLGAVEIKDPASGLRAAVKVSGGNNALVVVQNAQPLPTGAAKESTLSTTVARLEAILAHLSASVSVIPEDYVNYETSIAAVTTYTFTDVGELNRKAIFINLWADQDVTISINGGPARTIKANQDTEIDSMLISSISITPTVATNIKLWAN